MFKKEIPKLETDKRGNMWQIYHDLRDLYISCFTWHNLPDTVNQRYLELSLFTSGRVGFFKDKRLGYLALRAMTNSNLDVYGEPTNVTMIGVNGYTKNKTNHDDVVVIYDNYSRITRAWRLLTYATMLDFCEVAITQNVKHQKTPYIISAEENIVNSIKTMIKKVDDNEDLIIADKKMLGEDGIKIHEIKVDFVGKDLQELKQKIMNECLSFIGIENNSAQKNERVNVGEVMVSSGVSIAHRNSRYKARQIAIDEINEMFGLEIELEYTNPTVEDLNEVSTPEIGYYLNEQGGEGIE